MLEVKRMEGDIKMNKQIVEFDTQAKDYAAMELAVSGHGGIPRFNQLYRDKFAELIVRECGRIANGIENEAILPSSVIEEHFGVKL